jgi:uncharacterized membrane protein/nitrite reductase/ring-hydroxylating ferredoxin subunit
MRSNANIKSHPIHPMLIVFPIAFFFGTFIFDILGIITDHKFFYAVSSYMQLLGIIGGLVAAVPGAIDYFKTVPPNSSGKKRATKHALLNITNLVLFFIAWVLKGDDISPFIILGLEIIGIILLSIAGWLGGTLVYRNQIGVDPCYANAGKWKEEHKHATNGQIEVAATNELKANQMKLIHADKKRIVIGKTENGYVAFDDHCTHKGGSLAGGTMICGTVQCPWHGSQFDVNTGIVKAGPAKEKINTYSLSEKDGKIYLNLKV